MFSGPRGAVRTGGRDRAGCDRDGGNLGVLRQVQGHRVRRLGIDLINPRVCLVPSPSPPATVVVLQKDVFSLIGACNPMPDWRHQVHLVAWVGRAARAVHVGPARPR